MPGRVFRILWGTGNENVLDFNWPSAIDEPSFWRAPRPSSERLTFGGIQDSWVTGFYFWTQMKARWFGWGVPSNAPGSYSQSSQWSGPTGLQAFLTWAAQSNAFTWVPDTDAPDFQISGCYLAEPFDEYGISLEPDGSQTVGLKFWHPTADLALAYRGVMFEYAPGMDLTSPVAATFTRATAATRRGLPGNLAAAVGASDASGVLRDRHYEGSLRTTLLEAQRIQLVTNPENFGAWGQNGTPVLTSGQVDPFGGAAAYLLNDDDGAVLEGIQQTVTFTGDATKAFSLFLRAGTAALTEIDLLGAAVRHRVLVTWTNGVPALSTSAGAGTLFAVENYGGGWYRISASANGVVAADTNALRIFPAGTVAAATGTVFIFGADAWNATFPSSYQGPSLTTRNVDQFQWQFSHKPQAMFLLADFFENEVATSLADTRIVTIQADNENGPRVMLFANSGDSYQVRHEPVTGTIVGATIDKNPVRGDRMVLLGILNPDGSVKIGATKNGDTEAFSGTSGAAALAAAWSGPLLGIGSRAGTGIVSGFRAFARVKIGPLTFAGVTRDTIAKAVAA